MDRTEAHPSNIPSGPDGSIPSGREAPPYQGWGASRAPDSSGRHVGGLSRPFFCSRTIHAAPPHA
jgi:hypothetical protein